MNTNKSVLLHKGKYLALYDQDGWEHVQRVNASGVAILVPITNNQEIVLVEQHRVPVNDTVIELPAGLVGDEVGLEDEEIEAAAARELEEETGFRAGRLERIMSGPSSGGSIGETPVFFYADQLEKVSEGGGVEGENITVHVVPLVAVDRWLNAKMAEGLLVEAKVYAGLYWASQRVSD